ncbi:DUF2490 domain-containing protein [Bacteroidota bacterium]
MIFLLYLPDTGKAQELWSGGTLELDLLKGLSLEMTSQVRLEDGLARYNGYYGEAGMGYKINKYFKVKASYRYTNKAGHHDSEIRPTNNRERITGDLNFDIGKDVSFKYRFRYQYAKERNTDKEYNYLRNKFSVKYGLHKRAEPYIEAELFYRLDGKNELRAHRHTIGLDSKITDNLSVKNFYRVEKEINTNFPQKYYIIGIMFSYKLSR